MKNSKIFIFLTNLVTQNYLISAIDINGIYFTNEPSGQANFDYNNFDNSVKQAINAGFNRVYIGNYNYQWNEDLNVDPKSDVLLNWVDLSNDKIASVKSLATSKNSKICMIVVGIGQLYTRNVSPEEFASEIVDNLNEF